MAKRFVSIQIPLLRKVQLAKMTRRNAGIFAYNIYEGFQNKLNLLDAYNSVDYPMLISCVVSSIRFYVDGEVGSPSNWKLDFRPYV